MGIRTGGANVYLLDVNPVSPMKDPVYYLQSGGIQVPSGIMTTYDINYPGDKAHQHGVIIFDMGKASTTVSLMNDAQLILSAPRSGTYNKVAYFVDRNTATQCFLQSNSNMTVDGTFYAAQTTMRMETQFDLTINGQMVVGKLQVSSSGNFKLTWNKDLGFSVRRVSLTEWRGGRPVGRLSPVVGMLTRPNNTIAIAIEGIAPNKPQVNKWARPCCNRPASAEVRVGATRRGARALRSAACRGYTNSRHPLE